jgi:hypothetical protein
MESITTARQLSTVLNQLNAPSHWEICGCVINEHRVHIIFYHHNTTFIHIQQARYVSNYQALPQALHTTRSLGQWCDVMIQHGVSNSNIKLSKLSNKEGKYLIAIKHTTEILLSFNNATEFNNLLDCYFSLPTIIVPCHPGINIFETSGPWWRIFEIKKFSGTERGQILKFE